VASTGAAVHMMTGLNRGDGMPGIALVPDPVHAFGGDAELDDEVCREVLQTLIMQDFLASNHQKPRIVTHRGFPLSSPGESALRRP
jgi:hypothetical protein